MEENIFIPYRKKEKWGYCDFDKNLIIPCQFDGAESFIEVRAIVCMKKDTPGCLGFIDKNGNFVCDIKYTSLDDFKNRFAAVIRNGKWGFINKEGQE